MSKPSPTVMPIRSPRPSVGSPLGRSVGSPLGSPLGIEVGKVWVTSSTARETKKIAATTAMTRNTKPTSAAMRHPFARPLLPCVAGGCPCQPGAPYPEAGDRTAGRGVGVVGPGGVGRRRWGPGRRLVGRDRLRAGDVEGLGLVDRRGRRLPRGRVGGRVGREGLGRRRRSRRPSRRRRPPAPTTEAAGPSGRSAPASGTARSSASRPRSARARPAEDAIPLVPTCRLLCWAPLRGA